MRGLSSHRNIAVDQRGAELARYPSVTPSGRRVRDNRARLRVDRLAGAQHGAVMPAAGRLSSVQLRARNSTRSAGAPTRRSLPCRPMPAWPAGAEPTARTQSQAWSCGMVELQDARALAQHLDAVEIAIGVERVAGVVRGDGDDGAAPPSTRAAASTPRQRSAYGPCRWRSPDPADTCCTSASETTAMPASTALSMVRALGTSSSCTASDAAMAGHHPCPVNPVSSAASGRCSKACAEGSPVSSTWRSRSRPCSPAFSNNVSQPGFLGARILGDRAAEDTVGSDFTCCATASSSPGFTGVIRPERCETKPAIRSARPSDRASVRKTGQEMLVLRRRAVEMGADRHSAMRIGAAQREIHAAFDIGGGPVALAIGADREQRTEPGAVGVLFRRGQIWPLSRWVWMSTKAGRISPAVEIMARADNRRRARGPNGGDTAIGDLDIEAFDLAIADLAACGARDPGVAECDRAGREGRGAVHAMRACRSVKEERPPHPTLTRRPLPQRER